MKIIVEGPNNVGKSTFINELLSIDEFKDYRVEHVGSRCPNDIDFHRYFLENYDNIILDRFYVGETIYPDLYGRKGNMTENDLLIMANEFNDQTVHVFIDADIEFIAKAYENKGETPDWKFVYIERKKFFDRYKLLHDSGINCFYIYHRLGGAYLNDLSNEDVIKYLKSEV